MITNIGAAIDEGDDVLLWWDVACGCTDICVIADIIICRPILKFDTDYRVFCFSPRPWTEFYNTWLGLPYDAN